VTDTLRCDGEGVAVRDWENVPVGVREYVPVGVGVKEADLEQLGLMLRDRTEKVIVSDTVNVDVGDGVGVRVCEPE